MSLFLDNHKPENIEPFGDVEVKVLPETTDLGRDINEFLEINSNLEMPREERKFEGAVLAHMIANKLNDLSPEERHLWLMTLLGTLAEATNLAFQKGVEVETMWIPSIN